MTLLRNLLDDSAIVARITEILRLQWDPAGTVRDALPGDESIYHAQAIVVAGVALWRVACGLST